MIAIRYQGEFLDLYPEMGLDLTLKAPYFFEQSGDIIPGSYSFPFNIPATRKNMALLDYPDALDGPPLIEKTQASIYYDGFFLFIGDLYIKQGGNITISAYIIIAEFRKLEDQKLSEINFGGPINLGADLASALATAKDTAVNPQNYEYIFFPIENKDFFNDDPGGGPLTSVSEFQNYYDQIAQGFVSSADQQTAMPFLKLSFILEKIFTAQGFTFSNEFQDEDAELDNIVIYNNYSIYENATEWALEFNPANHVPDMTSREFIKRVCKVWSLAVVYDPFNKTVALRPTKNIAANSPVADWTKYTNKSYKIAAAGEEVNALCFEVDPDDDRNNLPRIIADLEYIGEVANTAGLPGSPTPGDNYYRWENDDVVTYTGPSRGWVVTQFGLRCYRPDPGENKLEIAAQPLEKSEPYPLVKIPGTSPHLDFKTELGHLRWTTYRGMQTYNGSLFPWATNSSHAVDGTQLGNFAHVWGGAGPYGIYTKFWKPWQYFLSNTKEVKATIYLPLAEFLNFDQSEKVRIGNYNYFVPEIRASMRRGKYIKCECRLLQTL